MSRRQAGRGLSAWSQDLEAVGASALLGKAEEVLLLKKRVQGAGQPGPLSDPETSSLLGAHGHPD